MAERMVPRQQEACPPGRLWQPEPPQVPQLAAQHISPAAIPRPQSSVARVEVNTDPEALGLRSVQNGATRSATASSTCRSALVSSSEQHKCIDWLGAAAGSTVGDGRARNGIGLAADAGHPRHHGVVDPREGQETIGTDLHVFSETSEDIQDLATDSLATDFTING